ncbi:sensor histidine kinase [Streptomyces sp. NPDC050560]|uniref:sensor histidine kinase n=1 Tax=Streptomyces sp. NPDC050560 TaxID=3365630 RepID=UPI00378E7043
MRFVARSVRSLGRGLRLAALAVAEFLLLVPLTVAVTALAVGVGVFLVPATVAWVRGAAGVGRRLAGETTGVPVPSPYLPEPKPAGGVRGHWQRTRWVLSDPATLRDLAWTLVDCTAGVLVALLPLTLVAYGVFGFLLPRLWDDIARAGGSDWYGFIHVTGSGTAWQAALLGIVFFLAGFALGPWAVRTHAAMAGNLLRPGETSRRLRHLAETRADVVNTSAAELRRIERDLHDGAQARLVALGMNLGVAEQLLADDPAAVAAILADTRKASATALRELRDLVRGIHPPVLADRGLSDAVRALALDSPLDVSVDSRVEGRADAPVESALYFAVCEALANAVKHADAERVTVDLRHDGGSLRARVSDDGRGGADPSRGTGLLGIQRRLAAFDGSLTVESPAGGPTTLTMELPCALS